MDVGDADLKPLRVLGQGTFGRVFLCQTRQSKTQKNVVVKRIIVINPKTQMKMILEEVYIISQLKHPRIVQFLRSFVHASTVNIVMEYVSNGTMRDVINKVRRVNCQFTTSNLSKTQLLQYFCDILMGLEYLHIRHVIHRDLKPENLLLDEHGRIKITDFGISAIHTPYSKTLAALGTPYYLAPEILRRDKYDFKSDIWSLGCIVYELCTGMSPFKQATDLDMLCYLVRVLTRQTMNCKVITDNYGPIWSRLCEQMLVYEPQRRISLPDILCMDSLITIPYYMQYFDYKYSNMMNY